MAKIKAAVRIGDKTWTRAEWNRMLKEADRAGEEYARRWPRIIAVRYDQATTRVVLDLSNGVQLAVLADKLQGVSTATEAQRSDVSILGPNWAIEFPQIDEQFTVSGLLSGVFGDREWMSKLARRKSRSTARAKSNAAKTNTRKAARPRKAVTA